MRTAEFQMSNDCLYGGHDSVHLGAAPCAIIALLLTLVGSGEEVDEDLGVVKDDVRGGEILWKLVKEARKEEVHFMRQIMLHQELNKSEQKYTITGIVLENKSLSAPPRLLVS